MGGLFDGLRHLWRNNFTLPGRGKARGWGLFVYYWLWSIAAVVPGALAAAYLIGQFKIIDQRLQDAVSIGVTLLVMLFVQGVVWALGLPLWALTRRTVHDRGFRYVLTYAIPASVGLALILSPFVLAGGAVYWYVTHPSAFTDVEATGAGGALIIKVLLILVNVVVWPAIKGLVIGIITRPFWRWFWQRDKAKPRGA